MLRIQAIYDRSLKMAAYPLFYFIFYLTHSTFSFIPLPAHYSWIKIYGGSDSGLLFQTWSIRLSFKGVSWMPFSLKYFILYYAASMLLDRYLQSVGLGRMRLWYLWGITMIYVRAIFFHLEAFSSISILVLTTGLLGWNTCCLSREVLLTVR